MSPPPSTTSPADVGTILASISRISDDEIAGSPPPSLRMPAEWSPHAACLILFPHNRQTFRLERAQREVLRVAQAIATHGQEDVHLLCQDETLAGWVREQVASMTTGGAAAISSSPEGAGHSSRHAVRSFVCPSDDTWVRDTGPTFVWQTVGNGPADPSTGHPHDDARLVGLSWDFNAYGGPEEGCYWPCDRDREVANWVCQRILHHPCYAIPIILEGGSIHTDGEGTVLTTKECLLHPNRNPHLSQGDIEQVLCRALGATKVIWLPTGLDADNDTNGHIDNFACFVAPGHVVLAWTDDDEEDAENYQRCREAERVLVGSTDAKGRPIQVTRLPLPSPPLRYTHEEAASLAYPEGDGDDDGDNAGGGGGSGNYIMSRHPGEKMAASYVNFYIANRAVVVPQFGATATDQMALDTLQGVFPDRKVIGVASREILLGGGNIHCQTQQVPASIVPGEGMR
jgi:agmatine deiminase